MQVDATQFEAAVNRYYESLYRFALSLSHREADAADLTQETYRRLAVKGHQLRDASKLKTWLFTTLYRHFVDQYQRESRFEEWDGQTAAGNETATSSSTLEQAIDAADIREALLALEEPFRSPLVLFYLEEHSYKEIAEILDIPLGTVMSRISRGRDLLRERLESPDGPRSAQASTTLSKGD